MISKRNLILLCILLSILGWLIRIYRFQNHVPIRGVFYPNNFYAPVYIVNNGHLYKVYQFDIESIVGQNIYSSATDVFRSIYSAILILFLDSSIKSPESIARVLNNFPWQAIILFPFTNLLLAKVVIPQKISMIKRHVLYLIIYLVSLFGTYQIIYLTNSATIAAPVGWSFIIIVLWIILKTQQEYKALWNKISILFIMTSIGVLGWYHTASVILFILISTMTILLYVLGDDQKLNKFLLMSSGIYFVLFFAYFMWISITFFINFTNKFVGLISFSQKTYYYQYIHLIEFSFPLDIKIASVLSQLIPSIIISMYVFIIAIKLLNIKLAFRKYFKEKENVAEKVLMLYLSAMPLVFLFIFYSYGFSMASIRTLQYSTLVSPIAITRLLSSRNIPLSNLIQKAIIGMLILSCAFSIYSYINTPIRESGVIDLDEYTGGEWLKHVSSDKQVPIFTDYRLSAIFVVDGYFEIATIWPDNSYVTDEYVEKVYYTYSWEELNKYINKLRIKGNPPEYLVLSKKMMLPSVGINVGGLVFQPMDDIQMRKFYLSPRLSLIYNNNKVFITRQVGI